MLYLMVGIVCFLSCFVLPLVLALILIMIQIGLILLIVYLVLIVILHTQIGSITLVGYGLVLLMGLLVYSYLNVLISLDRSILSIYTPMQIMSIQINLLCYNMGGMVTYLFPLPLLMGCLIHLRVMLLDAPLLMPLIRMVISNVG